MDINKTQALHDFSYFKNVLESGNAGLAKFYIPVDVDSFKLSGITISRNKGVEV